MLDVVERADVIVEMNNPGIWVFGSTDDDDRNMGMRVVVEYENRSGDPAAPPRRPISANSSARLEPKPRI